MERILVFIVCWVGIDWFVDDETDFQNLFAELSQDTHQPGYHGEGHASLLDESLLLDVRKVSITLLTYLMFVSYSSPLWIDAVFCRAIALVSEGVWSWYSTV